MKPNVQCKRATCARTARSRGGDEVTNLHADAARADLLAAADGNGETIDETAMEQRYEFISAQMRRWGDFNINQTRETKPL